MKRFYIIMASVGLLGCEMDIPDSIELEIPNLPDLSEWTTDEACPEAAGDPDAGVDPAEAADAARLCLADCTTATIAACEWPVAEECIAAQVACRAACPYSCAKYTLDRFYRCVMAAESLYDQQVCITILCAVTDECEWLDPMAAWYEVYYCRQRP